MDSRFKFWQQTAVGSLTLFQIMKPIGYATVSSVPKQIYMKNDIKFIWDDFCQETDISLLLLKGWEEKKKLNYYKTCNLDSLGISNKQKCVFSV